MSYFLHLRLSLGALNNEFIKKCCSEWQHKLANSEFGTYSISNNNTSSNSTTANNSGANSGNSAVPGTSNHSSATNSNYDSYESTLLNTSTTITRSTRLKQQKILQNLIPYSKNTHFMNLPCIID